MISPSTSSSSSFAGVAAATGAEAGAGTGAGAGAAIGAGAGTGVAIGAGAGAAIGSDAAIGSGVGVGAAGAGAAGRSPRRRCNQDSLCSPPSSATGDASCAGGAADVSLGGGAVSSLGFFLKKLNIGSRRGIPWARSGCARERRYNRNLVSGPASHACRACRTRRAAFDPAPLETLVAESGGALQAGCEPSSARDKPRILAEHR